MILKFIFRNWPLQTELRPLASIQLKDGHIAILARKPLRAPRSKLQPSSATTQTTAQYYLSTPYSKKRNPD